MVQDKLEDCQRVVIIITPKFLEDEWRVFEILQVRIGLALDATVLKM